MGAKKPPKAGTKAKGKATGAKKKAGPADPDKLTPKERLFVAHLLRENFNGKRAAIAAGYSAKTAEQIAYELRRKPRVAAAIAARQAELLAEIDADTVRDVNALRAIAHADHSDVVEIGEDGIPVRWTPTAEMDWATRASIAEYSHVKTIIPQKNGEPIEQHKVSFKQHSKLSALNALMKYREQPEGGANGKPGAGREAGDPDTLARAVLQDLGEVLPPE
jgi:hypothetical protein